MDGLGQETNIVLDYHHLNSIGQSVLKKTLINPLGIQTEMEFDALGRLHSLSKKNSFGVLLSSQKLFYDAIGNKTLEINDQIIDGKIIGAQKTEWSYGPMRLTGN